MEKKVLLELLGDGGPFSSTYIDDQVERVAMNDSLKLDELTTMLDETTDRVLTLEQTTTKLDRLRSEICHNQEELATAMIYGELEQYFHGVRSELERSIDECASGKVPLIVKSNQLTALCRTQSTSHLCHRAARRAFICESYSIKRDPDGLRFLMRIRLMVPMNEQSALTSRVNNIGRFLTNRADGVNIFQRIKGLPEYIVQTQPGPTGIHPVYADQCKLNDGCYICNMHEVRSSNDASSKCIRALLGEVNLIESDDQEMKQPKDVCETEQVRTSLTCKVTSTSFGYTVAVSKEITIRKTYLETESLSKCPAGDLCIVPFPEEGRNSFICDEKTISLTAAGDLQVLNEDTLKININGTSLENFEIGADKVKTYLRSHGVLSHYEKHRQWYHLVVIIIAGLIIIVLIARCIRFIGLKCRCRKPAEQWHPGSNIANDRCDI